MLTSSGTITTIIGIIMPIITFFSSYFVLHFRAWLFFFSAHFIGNDPECWRQNLNLDCLLFNNALLFMLEYEAFCFSKIYRFLFNFINQ